MFTSLRLSNSEGCSASLQTRAFGKLYVSNIPSNLTSWCVWGSTKKRKEVLLVQWAVAADLMIIVSSTKSMWVFSRLPNLKSGATFFQRVGQRNGCFTLERLISKIIIILCSSGCFRNGAKQQVHSSYQVSGKLYLSSFLLHWYWHFDAPRHQPNSYSLKPYFPQLNSQSWEILEGRNKVIN